MEEGRESIKPLSLISPVAEASAQQESAHTRMEDNRSSSEQLNLVPPVVEASDEQAPHLTRIENNRSSIEQLNLVPPVVEASEKEESCPVKMADNRSSIEKLNLVPPVLEANLQQELRLTRIEENSSSIELFNLAPPVLEAIVQQESHLTRMEEDRGSIEQLNLLPPVLEASVQQELRLTKMEENRSSIEQLNLVPPVLEASVQQESRLIRMEEGRDSIEQLNLVTPVIEASIKQESCATTMELDKDNIEPSNLVSPILEISLKQQSCHIKLEEDQENNLPLNLVSPIIEVNVKHESCLTRLEEKKSSIEPLSLLSPLTQPNIKHKPHFENNDVFNSYVPVTESNFPTVHQRLKLSPSTIELEPKKESECSLALSDSLVLPKIKEEPLSDDEDLILVNSHANTVGDASIEIKQEYDGDGQLQENPSTSTEVMHQNIYMKEEVILDDECKVENDLFEQTLTPQVSYFEYDMDPHSEPSEVQSVYIKEEALPECDNDTTALSNHDRIVEESFGEHFLTTCLQAQGPQYQYVNGQPAAEIEGGTFVADIQLPLPVNQPSTSVRRRLPEKVVIDKDGLIIYRPFGQADLTSRKYRMGSNLSPKPKAHRIIACPHCDYRANSECSLCYHIQMKHSSVPQEISSCLYCPYTTPYKYNLTNHLVNTHKIERFACPKCRFKSFSPIEILHHVQNTHDSLPAELCYHQCPHCTYKTVDVHRYKRHIALVHLKAFKYKCGMCDYKDIYLSKMKIHYKRHKPYIKLVQQEQLPSQLDNDVGNSELG